MTAAWQSKLARISGMDRREIQVRASQEVHKRRDLLMHKLGIRQDLGRSVAEARYGGGKFFFPSGDASVRARLLRQNLPDQAAAILREADDICAHKFRLLGYEALTFDPPPDSKQPGEIDWHVDPVHNKRAPLVPWFSIPFLNFQVVGDHKVTWELNRHQHLMTLAKAYLLSGNAGYADALILQWRSWINANPYPLGINWGSSLEVAFRSLSWIWVDQLLATSGSGNENQTLVEFRRGLSAALTFHGRYIEKYLSTYFSPNTHLLGEAVALFFLGTLYPGMPYAARWKASGWSIVLEAARRQVRPDGVYFEQSLYYHVYALDFFLYARILAQRNSVDIPGAFDGTLQKMLDVIEAQAQAGVAEGFGDDDGGRLFDPRRNRSEHLTDPLALGTLTYERAYSAARLTGESIWLFGDAAIATLSAYSKSSAARSQAFPDGGIYVMADSQPFAQVMTVDAGPQGVGRSGHGHADALSLRLTMNGRRWLVDSGSGVYIAEDRADRDAYRGTGAHNTLRVDGQDQAIADEPFSWTYIPNTKAETWIAGETFSYFVGSHNGYDRLSDAVTHRRHVFKIAGGIWLIRDVAIGHGEHHLEVRWHFASDLEARVSRAGCIDVSAKLSADGNSDQPALALVCWQNTPWHTETTMTVVSPAYGALEPAPLVKQTAQLKLPAEIATALMPRLVSTRERDSGSGETYPALTSMTHAEVQVYELTEGDATHGFFFGHASAEWSFGPWSSDAQFLYCRMEHEKIQHLIVVAGSKVGWQGEGLMKAAHTSEYFEWRAQEPFMHEGGFSLTDLFEVLTGSSGSEGNGLNRDFSNFVEKR